MIATLAFLTLRALLNRRRTLLLGLLGALIVVVAAIYRLGGPAAGESADFTGRLLANFGIAVLLPLVTVIVGTAALGSELDDGTIVYLLAKPVPRPLIVVVKLVVAWAVSSLLVALPILVAGIVGTGGDPGLGIGYGLAAVLGALEYTAVFLALSLVTSRALVIGLAYVVVWEGVVAGLFAGTRIVSIRQHALAVADALGGDGAVPAELAVGTAIVVGGIVTVAVIALAVRRLALVELRGETS
ncbi:MAG TPA: ABC transporter permease [Candidatus Limnocylindrales bacterium]|nr:ABC transporter permease [Candidatus Limnocylindrales bacterium]